MRCHADRWGGKLTLAGPFDTKNPLLIGPCTRRGEFDPGTDERDRGSAVKYRVAQCIAAVVLAAGAFGGCDNYFNMTQPLTDPITIGIVNKTPYRAILTAGAWEPLDQDSLVQFGNARLEGADDADAGQGVIWMPAEGATVACRREVHIGTQAMLNQIRKKEKELAAVSPITDEDAMVVGVNFSDAPADSPDAANPTVGYAEPIAVQHGVDYPCGSVLIFTLVEDPEAQGGFRINFGVIY